MFDPHRAQFLRSRWKISFVLSDYCAAVASPQQSGDLSKASTGCANAATRPITIPAFADAQFFQQCRPSRVRRDHMSFAQSTAYLKCQSDTNVLNAHKHPVATPPPFAHSPYAAPAAGNIATESWLSSGLGRNQTTMNPSRNRRLQGYGLQKQPLME